MTKKILLLVLFLPIIIMLCLFTTTDVVSLAIDIPVSGIDVFENNIVYLDLDEQEKYKVEYTVYPTNATNQSVSMETEQINDIRLAELDYKDGYIIPKSIGMAKVYMTTADGGFKDSFVVQVDSNMLQEINSEISSDEIYVGDKAIITTEFIPSNAKNQVLTYTSSDELVAKVDKKGNVTGVGRGEAIITVASIDDSEIKSTVTIKVNNANILDVSQPNLTIWNSTGTTNLSIDSDVEYELSYQILDSFKNPISNSPITISFGEEDERGNVALNYEFIDSSFIGTLTIELTITTKLGHSIKKEIEIKKVDKVEVSFGYLENPSFTEGTTNLMDLMINPIDANVTYVVSASNENVEVNEIDGIIILKAKKPGVTTVTVKVYSEGVTEPVEDTVTCVILPSKFNINELSQTYGIEGTWTVGGIDINDNVVEHKVNLSYGKTTENDPAGEGFLNNVHFEAVDKLGNKINSISIDETGLFKITDSKFAGEAYLKAVFEYENVRKESQALLVKCVGEAVNVTCYEELLIATRKGKAVVLKNNIDDFGFKKDKTKMSIEETYVEIPTTYDWTYYKNINYAEPPKIMVLIQFKNNVYGNGYTINAHNITHKLDSTGALNYNEALFTGPLNFVGVTDSSASAVSVKGQDNICYAVYENVTISNVELKGCNLDSGNSDSYNLKDLTYIGTTVEVLGDNVNIEYSRLTNGRTVLRAFGDVNDPNKVINVNIKNSILSGAREFIIRMGSNSFVQGSLDNISPILPNNTITNFPAHGEYMKMNREQKNAYDSQFIKTFVNVKNSAFKDCGIFSIGMDAHFAGPLLADGSSKDILDGKFADLLGPGWKDLAKTSYGAKLTFDGEVQIYDWKKLDNVDSSTLIEILGNNSTFNKLKFDVKYMVEQLANPEKFEGKFKNIVYKDTQNNINYVHGGIAFFGGGKNYDVFEAINETNESIVLSKYQVSFSDVSREELQMAAGNEEFYFLLCDATSSFTPMIQKSLIDSGKAYEFVYKK